MTALATKKVFSVVSAIILCLGIGLLVLGVSALLQTRNAAVGIIPVDNGSPTTKGLGSSFVVAEKPDRLRIPSIGVDAHVESVGLSWHGTGDMAVPTNFTNVAWYNGGPHPGMPGTAVIDGHLDGKDVPEAVFYNLDKLVVGDTVEVTDTKGNTLQFRVTASKTYDFDAPTADIFGGDASVARLNLITCAGSWDKTQKLYNKRLVVFTELVNN